MKIKQQVVRQTIEMIEEKMFVHRCNLNRIYINKKDWNKLKAKLLKEI